MIEHKNISSGNRHGLENWIVQNETELNALEVDSLDVGKVAYKSDDDSYWRLKSTTLWVRITIIYSVEDGGLTEINFTTDRRDKLDGIDLTTKLNKTNPAIVGSITETVYNLTGTIINPANGTIQYKTLSANTTFTESLAAGQSVTLRIAGGDTFTVAYPTITWVGGTAPVLTANDVIVFWKESTVLYGAYIGSLV